MKCDELEIMPYVGEAIADFGRIKPDKEFFDMAIGHALRDNPQEKQDAEEQYKRATEMLDEVKKYLQSAEKN